MRAALAVAKNPSASVEALQQAVLKGGEPQLEADALAMAAAFVAEQLQALDKVRGAGEVRASCSMLKGSRCLIAAPGALIAAFASAAT